MPFEFKYSVDVKRTRYYDMNRAMRDQFTAFRTSWDKSALVLKEEVRDKLQRAASELIKRHSGAYDSTGPRALSKRSGRLVEQLQKGIRVSGSKFGDITGSLNINARYMIHETGGVVRPKTAKYLAVPLKAALKSNGTPKRRKPRDWPNTFVIESKRGNLLICRRVGKEIEPLYVLLKSARIPARLGLRKAVDKQFGKDFGYLAANRITQQVMKELSL